MKCRNEQRTVLPMTLSAEPICGPPESVRGGANGVKRQLRVLFPPADSEGPQIEVGQEIGSGSNDEWSDPAQRAGFAPTTG